MLAEQLLLPSEPVVLDPLEPVLLSTSSWARRPRSFTEWIHNNAQRYQILQPRQMMFSEVLMRIKDDVSGLMRSPIKPVEQNRVDWAERLGWERATLDLTDNKDLQQIRDVLEEPWTYLFYGKWRTGADLENFHSVWLPCRDEVDYLTSRSSYLSSLCEYYDAPEMDFLRKAHKADLDSVRSIAYASVANAI